MKLETFFEKFELFAEAPNGVQKMRELIVQLAVQGKLVQQDPSDEPASVLLKNIQIKKKQLIKEKKIKKIERLISIDEEEIPFLLPIGWQWIRLGEVIYSMTNGIYKPDTYYSDDGVACLRMYNIHKGKLNFKNLKRITVDEVELEQYKLLPGDLLVNRVNSRELVGKSAVIEDIEEPLIFESKNIRVRFLMCKIFTQYINILFQTYYVRNVFEGYAKQTTGQASINQPQVANILVPLPPVEEQHRIVAKVDQLMSLCDELEERQQKKRETRVLLNNVAINQLLTAREPDTFAKHWQRICNNFDLLYSAPENIGKLRQAILQLAVMGKLVPQDPNDEPAWILLEKIKTKKQQLIQDKKIRKDKAVSEIDVNQIPYKLPINWTWVRLDEISDIGTGSTPLTSKLEYYDNGNIPWITSSATSQDFIRVADTYITTLAVSDYRLRIYTPGTLIVALYGQGKTRGQISQLKIAATINQACAAITFFEAQEELENYVKQVFKKKYDELRALSAGGAQPNLNVSKIKETLIPLPPVQEQKRIVARIDQLMSLCDELETKLIQSQTNSEKLMNTAVQKLLLLS